jgi:hypothetical protein
MKIIIFILTVYFLIFSISNSEIIDCSEHKKVSKEYIKCQKNNVKTKSNEYGITKKINKFKSSKTLTDLFKKGN